MVDVPAKTPLVLETCEVCPYTQLEFDAHVKKTCVSAESALSCARAALENATTSLCFATHDF
jgi:hypothetical protein